MPGSPAAWVDGGMPVTIRMNAARATRLVMPSRLDAPLLTARPLRVILHLDAISRRSVRGHCRNSIGMARNAGVRHRGSIAHDVPPRPRKSSKRLASPLVELDDPRSLTRRAGTLAPLAVGSFACPAVRTLPQAPSLERNQATSLRAERPHPMLPDFTGAVGALHAISRVLLGLLTATARVRHGPVHPGTAWLRQREGGAGGPCRLRADIRRLGRSPRGRARPSIRPCRLCRPAAPRCSTSDSCLGAAPGAACGTRRSTQVAGQRRHGRRCRRRCRSRSCRGSPPTACSTSMRCATDSTS